MRPLKLLFAVIGLHVLGLHLSPLPLDAQAPEGITRRDSLIELDFQGTDIQMVLAALADVGGLNVVYGVLPAQKVTLRTGHPIAPNEVRGYLESVARTNGLQLTDEGGLIRIGARPDTTPVAPARRMARDGEQAQTDLRLFVYRLRHGQAEAIAATLSNVFGSGSGAARGGPASLSEQLREQRVPPFDEAQAAAGAPGAPGAQPQGPGLPVGLRGAVQIVPDLLTNSLLIRATLEDYETIRVAVEELDVRPLQVLIEVLIAEVRRNRQLSLGISAKLPDQVIPGSGGATIGGELQGASAGDLMLRVLGLGSVKADVLLSALASQGNVRILSRPVVLAQNNQEARILVGSERPFVQLFRALPTDNAVRDQVVQYRDVGTQLTLRPTINPDGYVSLQVLQEVSSATAESQFGAPIISTREAKTQLLVKDGQTIIIGGLIDNQKDHAHSGIPILKDIPLLGRLFRSTTERNDQTEMFIFLTPRVLRTDADIENATDDLRGATEILRQNLKGPIPIITPSGDRKRWDASAASSPTAAAPRDAAATPPRADAPVAPQAAVTVVVPPDTVIVSRGTTMTVVPPRAAAVAQRDSVPHAPRDSVAIVPRDTIAATPDSLGRALRDSTAAALLDSVVAAALRDTEAARDSVARSVGAIADTAGSPAARLPAGRERSRQEFKDATQAAPMRVEPPRATPPQQKPEPVSKPVPVTPPRPSPPNPGDSAPSS